MDTASIAIILPILKRIPLFAELDEKEHQEIINNIVLNYFPLGHIFCREGDAVNEESQMFIIKHGMVKISRMDKGTGQDREIAVLADNDFFGEMALVQNEPRNATATAIGECEIFQLKKSDFLKLMQTNQNMATRISEEFINRLKKNNKNIA